MRPATESQLRQRFSDILDGIVAGTLAGCPTDTGLDDETIAVLDLLARQPNPKRPADIAACRTEFARMLDGTHEREADDDEAAAWAELLA